MSVELAIALLKVCDLMLKHFSCDLVGCKLWESIEREDALHWLSTLGGAFSNLGEHSLKFVIRHPASVYFLEMAVPN